MDVNYTNLLSKKYQIKLKNNQQLKIFFKPQDFHSTWKICQNQRLGVMFTLLQNTHTLLE